MEVVQFTREEGPYFGLGMYAIKKVYDGREAFFRWCYFSKARAQHVANRLTIDNEQDFEANWTRHLRYAVPSDYEKGLHEKRMVTGNE